MRRIRRLSEKLAVLVAVLWMLIASTADRPLTVYGTQCPTAAVQTIAVKTCCPGVTIRRAPHPGEKGFQQCFCAEKKRAESGTVTMLPKMDMLTISEGPPALSFAILPQRTSIGAPSLAAPVRFVAPPEPPPPSV